MTGAVPARSPLRGTTAADGRPGAGFPTWLGIVSASRTATPNRPGRYVATLASRRRRTTA